MVRERPPRHPSSLRRGIHSANSFTEKPALMFLNREMGLTIPIPVRQTRVRSACPSSPLPRPLAVAPIRVIARKRLPGGLRIGRSKELSFIKSGDLVDLLTGGI